MKKLLLTIFAIAAIVACDKDAYDQEVTNINVLEQAEEINASVELSDDEILDIVDSVLGINIKKGSTRGNKTSTRKGDDRVTLHIFQFNGVNHIAFVDDTNDDLCFNPQTGFTLLSSVHLNKQTGSNNIEVTLGEDTAVISTVNGDYSALFNLNFNLIMQLDASGAVSLQEFYTAHNVGTVGGNTVRFGCATEYYRVTDAPFPLNGHLATITDAAGLTAAFGGSSRNFAGTSSSTVVSTIEAEIMNGSNN